jgi:hypothetical protein
VVPRRTLAIIAVVIVLAVLGTILALSLGGDDKDNGSSGSAKGGTSASAGGASADTDKGDASGKDQGQDPGNDQGKDKGESKGKGKDDDSGKGSDDSGTGSSKAGDVLPDGYRTVTNKQFHFTMAMPKNFTRYKIAGSNSGQIYAVDGGFPRVQIDYNSSPGNDAAAAWNAARGAVAASSDGYRHIGIKKVEFNGYPTVADWEFERTQQGQRIRVLNRGFRADDTHGYSIMISCKASEWNGKECRTLRETAFATFKPKD